MELWIRRQDRQKLVKVKTIEILDHYANNTREYMYTAININGEQFASYKSKERALEVLNEIDEFVDLLNNNLLGISDDGIHRRHSVYQMPKE